MNDARTPGHGTTDFDQAGEQKMKTLSAVRIIATAALLGCGITVAQAEATSPLQEGPYLSLMGTGVFPESASATKLDDGYGGTLAMGYRQDIYAVEVAGTIADLSGATLRGFAVNGLLFPFSSWRHVYATVGLSGLEYADFKTSTTQDKINFNTVNIDGGVGLIWPLSIGRYDYGVRAEVRYRAGQREEDYNDLDNDLDAPKHFKHWVLNIGFVLPSRKRPAVVAAAPVEAAVVAPSPPACSDGQDNDGDGQLDHPQDPGCSAADDADETDEAPPCQTPAAGEQVSLNGCKTGDVLVLRGVNFEFDQARLTANAKTLLDGVADALLAMPQVRFEISGHTDARGSEAYNQQLSERRAQAVVDYLASKGVATDRMTAAGFGESQPLADNDSDEGREANRRVQLKLLESGMAAAPAPEAVPAPADVPAEAAAGAMAPAASDVADPTADPTAEPAM